MMDAAEHDYIKPSGILRQRIYYHWSLHAWVQAPLVDIGRPDSTPPSTAPLVEEGRFYALSSSSDNLDRIIAYLEDNGPCRPVQISEDLGLAISTICSIFRRWEELFTKRKHSAAKSSATFYALKED